MPPQLNDVDSIISTYNLDIDRDLYISLFLSLISSNSLIVSSYDINYTTSELLKQFKLVFGFKDLHINHMNLNDSNFLDSFKELSIQDNNLANTNSIRDNHQKDSSALVHPNRNIDANELNDLNDFSDSTISTDSDIDADFTNNLSTKIDNIKDNINSDKDIDSHNISINLNQDIVNNSPNVLQSSELSELSIEKFKLHFTISVDQLKKRYKSSATLIKPINIITGIENLSINYQIALLDILKKKKLLINNIYYFKTDIFITILILDNKIQNPNQNNNFKLYKPLEDQFFFKQPNYPKLLSSKFNLPENVDFQVYNQIPKKVQNNIPNGFQTSKQKPKLSANVKQILSFRSQIPSIEMISEIKRYIFDIIIFTRNHRVVNGGIPTRVIAQFETMVKSLCIYYNYSFVIPSIVKLAARKLLPLKIHLLSDINHEPTLQYGSDSILLQSMLEKWDVDKVIQDVLRNVQTPI
ncbi:Mtc2p ASCRUDRAFT_77235 [Ascoidea rubescens DSM 1968]|uniref:Uncharacterized protein n=1 Tax=Ascoidea rubescens DSM 1968 TaxID=1344418 RepID=A0A1D2VCC2_9ASCO|nr:hypothetical protein ASCRUDRAFT_77235 [Ascoidea rubescens DSM 1968]ODV59137.1 hypothetical protein ASCRUDRAFT_77235 [Ascoidea rubescens DSM 1968]